MRSLGKKVTTDNVTGQDVTEEYVDLQSRERNLLAVEQSLLKLHDEANSVQDTLTIQRELTNVLGEIELIQGRIKYLDNRTAFSRITLNIQPVASSAPPEPAWSPLRVAAKAWSASLDVLQTLATALISVLAFGWWLAPVLITGYLLVETALPPAASDTRFFTSAVKLRRNSQEPVARTYLMAASYPCTPIPATTASTAGETTEVRRQSSRAWMLDICTSTLGTVTVSRASWMA